MKEKIRDYQTKLALLLTLAILFSGICIPLPVQSAKDACGLITVQAAVAKPTGLKLTVKKKSSSQVELKCSWGATSTGHYQYIIQYSSPASSGERRGEGTALSDSYTVDVDEGIPYTFTLQVRSYNQSGQTSAIAKKTKSYLLTGKATKTIKKVIKKNIKSSMTDFEKVRFVHDWIIKRVTYDGDNPKYTFHEAVLGKKAVCQGYTLTFLAFMNQMDIPCKFVVSSNGQHSWNMVKVNKKWYHVDVTNDDPKEYESTTKKYPIYTHFLQSTKNFQKKVNNMANHQYDTSAYPSATNTKYDNPATIGNYQEDIPDQYPWRSDNTFKPWVNGKMMSN